MDTYQWWLEQGKVALNSFRISQCMNKPELCSNQQPWVCLQAPALSAAHIAATMKHFSIPYTWLNNLDIACLWSS